MRVKITLTTLFMVFAFASSAQIYDDTAPTDTITITCNQNGQVVRRKVRYDFYRMIETGCKDAPCKDCTIIVLLLEKERKQKKNTSRNKSRNKLN